MDPTLKRVVTRDHGYEAGPLGAAPVVKDACVVNTPLTQDLVSPRPPSPRADAACPRREPYSGGLRADPPSSDGLTFRRDGASVNQGVVPLGA